MKKILLTMVALMAMAFTASADDAKPTYTATGNTTSTYHYIYDGTDYQYSTTQASAPSLKDLSVEVYEGETNTIIVRGWWGNEGYDLGLTLDASGNVTSYYPIVNGTANPYVYNGYSYVDVDSNSDVLAMIYGSYSWYATDDTNAYIVLGLYYNSVWGYYVISWPLPSAGINGVTANAENENAPMYNLAGQRVSKNAKGLVIKNGKKMILK